MDMTISVGWWVLPTFVTLATFGYAVAIPGEPTRGDYSFPDPMPLVRFVGALVVSLVAWLIYALAT
jgi:hypothetical protein